MLFLDVIFCGTGLGNLDCRSLSTRGRDPSADSVSVDVEGASGVVVEEDGRHTRGGVTYSGSRVSLGFEKEEGVRETDQLE